MASSRMRLLRYSLHCCTLLLLLTSGCRLSKEEEQSPLFRDWEKLIHSDTLRIGTTTSPSVFFVYRGEDMGCEYTSALSFAKYHKLGTDVHFTHSIDTLMAWVKSGFVDVCITPLPMTRQNNEDFTFCGPTEMSGLVLAQQKNATPIRSVLNLKDRQIHVLKSSAEEIRMQQIAREISPATSFEIISEDTLGIEDLLDSIGKVSNFFVVADERLAQAYASFHDKLDIETKLSVPIRYGWVVHKDNNTLADSLSQYFQEHPNTHTLKDTYSRLYSERLAPKTKRHYAKGLLSPYDEIFKKESLRLSWGWTLLAAIAFKESNFRPSVVAWSGATGLMGIMPATGRSFGANQEELLDPEVSVRVGVDCLRSYSRYFSHIQDDLERLYFVLASYNAGVGHIQDACRLAEKHGEDPCIWYGSVRKYVLLKSTPEYYNDPVCKYGYLRGKETVSYVDDIIEKLRLYNSFTKEAAPSP